MATDESKARRAVVARADLLISLVRAANMGDRELIRRTVDSVIADERAKHHDVLADRLEQAASNGRKEPRSIASSTQSEAAPALVEISPSGRTLDDLVLSDANRVSLIRLVEEQNRADLLRSHGLEPRHRLLLAGPPGNGKTALSDVLGYELAVPVLSVRYERLVASLLGETSSRLQRVFEYARSRHCILFFDEFDTLAKERGDIHETGEIKRVVSSLLLQIDALPSYVVVTVATNHPELLDRAVWRRFQLRLEFPAPTSKQAREWFERAVNHGTDFGLSPRTLAERLKATSYSQLEDFTLDFKRRMVLADFSQTPQSISAELLDERRIQFTPAPEALDA